MHIVHVLQVQAGLERGRDRVAAEIVEHAAGDAAAFRFRDADQRERVAARTSHGRGVCHAHAADVALAGRRAPPVGGGMEDDPDPARVREKRQRRGAAAVADDGDRLVHDGVDLRHGARAIGSRRHAEHRAPAGCLEPVDGSDGRGERGGVVARAVATGAEIPDVDDGRVGGGATGHGLRGGVDGGAERDERQARAT